MSEVLHELVLHELMRQGVIEVSQADFAVAEFRRLATPETSLPSVLFEMSSVSEIWGSDAEIESIAVWVAEQQALADAAAAVRSTARRRKARRAGLAVSDLAMLLDTPTEAVARYLDGSVDEWPAADEFLACASSQVDASLILRRLRFEMGLSRFRFGRHVRRDVKFVRKFEDEMAPPVYFRVDVWRAVRDELDWRPCEAASFFEAWVCDDVDRAIALLDELP